MSLTAAQWKAQTEQDIRSNIHKYLNIGIQSMANGIESHLKPASFADLGNTVEIKFASDDKIQAYINGNEAAQLDVCCLVCLRLPFWIQQCSIPHNDPCNMYS